MMKRAPGIALLLAVVLGDGRAAAGTDPVSAGLRNCANQSDEHLRLKCFDDLAASLSQLKTERFGMTAAVASKREPAAAKPPLVDPEVLDATIAALRQGQRGEHIFTLDNGQIWIEQDARPGVHFSVGQTVQIKHGAMSSLWLSDAAHRMTRVKRIS